MLFYLYVCIVFNFNVCNVINSYLCNVLNKFSLKYVVSGLLYNFISRYSRKFHELLGNVVC